MVKASTIKNKQNRKISIFFLISFSQIHEAFWDNNKNKLFANKKKIF